MTTKLATPTVICPPTFELRWGEIYWADYRNFSRVTVAPPEAQRRKRVLCTDDKRHHLWQQTESGKSESKHFDKHRKWCAVLSHEEFEQFLIHLGLLLEDCGTLGAVGMPGSDPEYCLSPAFYFRGDDPDASTNAYVQPQCDLPNLIQFLRWIEFLRWGEFQYGDRSMVSQADVDAYLQERVPDDWKPTCDADVRKFLMRRYG